MWSHYWTCPLPLFDSAVRILEHQVSQERVLCNRTVRRDGALQQHCVQLTGSATCSSGASAVLHFPLVHFNPGGHTDWEGHHQPPSAQWVSARFTLTCCRVLLCLEFFLFGYLSVNKKFFSTLFIPLAFFFMFLWVFFVTVGLPSGGILSLPKMFLDPRRPEIVSEQSRWVVQLVHWFLWGGFFPPVSVSNLFTWSPVKRTWYRTHQSCWSVQSGSSTTIRLYQECEGFTLPPRDWNRPAWWVCHHNTDKYIVWWLLRWAFLVLAVVCRITKSFDRMMSWKKKIMCQNLIS